MILLNPKFYIENYYITPNKYELQLITIHFEGNKFTVGKESIDFNNIYYKAPVKSTLTKSSICKSDSNIDSITLKKHKQKLSKSQYKISQTDIKYTKNIKKKKLKKICNLQVIIT